MKTIATALPLALLLACSQAAPEVAANVATDAAAPSPVAAPAQQAVTEVATATAPSTPLQVGQHAPDFNAQAWLAGEPFEFRLADALAKGPVVVYFFPAAFTPGCNLEARLFSEAIDRFKAQHATVIGITAGNADQLEAFSKDNETCSGKFAVAADPGAIIAAKYGAVLEARPEWSSRTSFAIRPDGSIARVHSDMKPQEHVREMLAGVGG